MLFLDVLELLSIEKSDNLYSGAGGKESVLRCSLLRVVSADDDSKSSY